MTTNAIAALLANVLESKGITPESLLQSADLARLLHQAEQVPVEAQEATVQKPTNAIVVKGVVVPAPVKGAPITTEMRKAYNSALSRTGNGTLGQGGATYENLLTKFAVLSGIADSPAVAKTTTVPVQNVSLEQALLNALTGGEARKGTAEPGTLRHAIATYERVEKTRIWVKADGTRVPCSEKQYRTWAQRRTEAQTRNAGRNQPTVVEPVVPSTDPVAALAALLAPMFAGLTR